MARYQDYVKEDSISDEIDVAAKKTEQRRENPEDGFVMPTKFEGKSTEEVVQSYVELEKLQSRQAQAYGEQRKQVDEYINLQSPQSSAPEEVTPPVTVDDIYANAEEAITRVVDKQANTRLDALEEGLRQTRLEDSLSKLDSKRDGWRETATDPAFLNWLAEDPYRQRLADQADNLDFEAADTLFGLYDDLKGSAQINQNLVRDKQLKDATLESSSASYAEPTKQLSRTELLERRISAKRGDPEARRWLAQHSSAITLAYEEGRIID